MVQHLVSAEVGVQANHKLISRRDMAVFAVKSSLLKSLRLVQDVFNFKLRKFKPDVAISAEVEFALLSKVVTPLYTSTNPEERRLQLGKIENLRVAVRAFDKVIVPANCVMSFWKQLGPPLKNRGFVLGRELRQGCLIPTIGGGLCQLSNSIHLAAKQAGCAIIERHSHTAPIENSPFSAEDDATVYWNYIDLRFCTKQQLRLRSYLTADELIVCMEAMP